MGLRSSKHNAPATSSSHSSSGAVVRRNRPRRMRLLKSSCLRSHGSDNEETKASDSTSQENDKTAPRPTANKSESYQVSAECYGLEDWGESSFTNPVSTEHNNTSRALSSRALKPARFLSRFSFHPRNLSFRLSRPHHSSGPARAYTSPTFTPSNDEEEQEIPPNSLISRNVRRQGLDFCPNYSNNLLDARNLFSETSNFNTGGPGTRPDSRRVASREPIEQNVRFSRTLSVGRLRDRVLRRTHGPDVDLFRYEQEEEAGHPSQVTRMSNGDDNRQVSSGNASSSVSISFYGNNEFETTPRGRETRYRDILAQRSNFLERRRRIRYQLRSLQRLGSRIGNLSGHERACVLSGQHLAGHCNCRIAAREANSNDDATARASISRIGMLAEALFEVLDEIHQQSVVLSSRQSASSTASIPAPNEVVDSLPVKIFSKLKKKPREEDAQCYICLVEYDEGDRMRRLPCHHEFHVACVDKWLREIHRVCPLCRGDICRPDTLTSGNGYSVL